MKHDDSPLPAPRPGGAFPRYGFNMFMSPDADPSAGAAQPADPSKTTPAGENGGADPAKTVPAPTERLFTQAELDQQINARLAREKRAAEDAAKLAAQEAERKKLAEQGEYKQLLDREREEAKAKVAAAEAARVAAEAKAQGMEIERVLERACAKAVKPDQVAALLRGAVQLDPATGAAVVIGASGAPMIDPKTARPITVERYAETWLEANPHFLPASTKAGAGSTPAASTAAAGGVRFDPALAHDIEHVKAAAPDIERQRLEKLRSNVRGT